MAARLLAVQKKALVDRNVNRLGAIGATGVKTDLSDEQVVKLGKLVIKHGDQLTKNFTPEKEFGEQSEIIDCLRGWSS